METNIRAVLVIIAFAILTGWLAYLLISSRRMVKKALGLKRFRIQLFVSYYFEKPGQWHTGIVYGKTLMTAIDAFAKKQGIKEYKIGEVVHQGAGGYVVNIFFLN